MALSPDRALAGPPWKERSPRRAGLPRAQGELWGVLQGWTLAFTSMQEQAPQLEARCPPQGGASFSPPTPEIADLVPSLTLSTLQVNSVGAVFPGSSPKAVPTHSGSCWGFSLDKRPWNPFHWVAFLTDSWERSARYGSQPRMCVVTTFATPAFVRSQRGSRDGCISLCDCHIHVFLLDLKTQVWVLSKICCYGRSQARFPPGAITLVTDRCLLNPEPLLHKLGTSHPCDVLLGSVW